MEAIDFMNNKLYDKKPGFRDDLTSHPKLAVIRPDGTILYSDVSNDGKTFLAFGEEKICDNHTDYMKVLVERYFSQYPNMVEDAKKGNLFASIFELIEDGNVVFNNTTTYQGPTFFLHGIHGQLLLPAKQVTDAQKNSLEELNPYVSYFKEIEVKEYTDVSRNEKETYFEPGDIAITNYLNRSSVKTNAKA